MERTAYEAINLKLEKDRMEIELEIAKLQEKKAEVVRRRDEELKKLSLSTNILKEKKTINASFLQVRFNHEVVERCNRETELIERLITEQHVELEKVKEKGRYIENAYGQLLKELQNKERRREEEMLLDFKHWSGF